MSDDEVEDWFGLIVEDDGTVWGISYDGDQYVFGHDQGFYRDLIGAGFPLQCDYGPAGRGHLFADFSFPPSLLPLADVTAYLDYNGVGTPERRMGEAGAVVHNWLAQHPDVAVAALESVGGGPGDQ